MASDSLAQTFIQDIQAQNAKRDDTAALWGQAAQVAQMMQNTQQQAELLKQKQEQMKLAKMDKITNAFELASKIDDGAVKRAYVNNHLPNLINALGMADEFHPTSLKMMQSDPLVSAGLRAGIRDGALKDVDLFRAARDPDYLAQIYPKIKQYGSMDQIKTAVDEEVGDFEKASQFASSEEGKAYRAKLAADAASSRAAGGRADTGSVKTDSEFAKTYNDYINEGGRATVEKNIGLIKEAIQEMESNKTKTGGLLGLLPDKAMDIANPNVAALRDRMQTAIQNSLRPILGGQFAAVEGQQILERVFNPRQPTKENIARAKSEVKDLMKRLEQRDKAVKYWEANGQSLKGFRGSLDEPAADTVTLGNGKSYTLSQLEAASKTVKNVQLKAEIDAAIAQLKSKQGKKK